MRRLSLAAMIVFGVSAVSFALTLAGCDQLNKPMRTPRGSSSSSSGATSDDAGDSSGEGGAPAPMITAQPGDIHL